MALAALMAGKNSTKLVAKLALRRTAYGMIG
jgi:hypothetical protein